MRHIPIGLFLSLTFATYRLSVSVNTSQKQKSKSKPLEWWQQSVVYQIYPRSFKDSDGDGVGDLNGITSELDYFVDLGIDAIWISPIYESPMKDFGYDISNFTNIDPTFGTLDDFKFMAEELKKRDMKIIMDMVPNHSSDLHEWFNKSVERTDPYTDYYVWKDANGTDANGKPRPPNNWVSVFSGSAWEWNEKRGQFYLHQFVKEQPDLNFENINVQIEILAVIKFWLDIGVEGFRMDAVPHMYEDQRFLDEPENPWRDSSAKPDEHRYWDHIYTHNLPQNLDFLAHIRQLLDVYSKADGRVRCMMVEATVSNKYIGSYYGTPDRPISHFPFNFRLLGVRPEQNASQVLGLMNLWLDLMPKDAWPTYLLGNHDNRRVPTRWTEGSVDGANMINLLVKGTAITYYGEELGMIDTFLTWEETVDPAGCNTDPGRYENFSRDPARTPFHWNNQTNAGFSTANKTWLPLNPNYKTINLAAQKAAEESHVKIYKEILKLRHTEAWRYGSYQSQALNSDKVLAFARIPSQESNATGYVVLVNLSDDQVSVNSGVFTGIPSIGTVHIRSVDFHNGDAVIGGSINLTSVLLGPRDSIVIVFTPTF